MNETKTQVDNEEKKKEILEAVQICRKCRMCVSMCPTHEGWFTQSAMGRLTAINLHLKYGLGSDAELSKLLYACTSCRRCEERCKIVSMGVSPADIIIKTKALLVKRQEYSEKNRR
jgi:Fe-S oxidoreductase